MSRGTIRLPHDAYRLLQTLRAAGHSAYVVGGCVRDSLLGRLPGDWDICTSARPDEMKALFCSQRLILTGEKHGTVAVILHGKPYEMTTYRLDGSYRDHRHPDNVQFVDDLAADLARRDFTINAMAYAPGEGVIDLYGGRSDLAARVVRCVGTPADRFAEDALRILRALRFSAKLGFTLDPATEAAALAARDTLHTVSAERLYAELDGLLLSPGAGKALAQYGEILSGAVPEILPCIGCTQPGKWHCYDVWQHSAAAVGALDLRALRFAAKLGFTLDPATEAAALAARDTLHTVSAERLYAELDGLLLSPGAGKALAQYGEILSGAVPEILPCIGCTQPGKWHCYDVWQHSAAAVGALDLRGQDTRGVRVLCWATFLHDIAKPLCRSVGPDGAAHFKGHNQRGAQLARVILRRLKAPAYLVDGAVGLIAVHDAPLPADDVGILKQLNRSGAIFLRRLCALKYADLDAHANTPEVAARRADVAAFERRMNELAKTGCYTMRQLAVNGADLMDIGIPAGPGVGATLQTLLNDVMEGTLPNEREALLAAAVK